MTHRTITACARNVSWYLHTSTTPGPLYKKLNSFLALPDGWHFGEGRPPSFGLVGTAAWIAQKAEEAGAEDIEVFPDPEGGILMSAYRGEDVLEVLCASDGTFQLSFERPVAEELYEEGLSLMDVENKIGALEWPKLNSSDFFIQSTIASERSDIKALRFREVVTKGYLLSEPVASPDQVDQFASTYETIMMPDHPEIRRYSGDFPQIPFQKHIA